MTGIVQLLKEFSQESAINDHLEQHGELSEKYSSECVTLVDDDEEIKSLSEEIYSIESSIENMFGAMESMEGQVSYLEQIRSKGIHITPAMSSIYKNAVTASMESRHIPEELWSDIAVSFESDDKKEDDKKGDSSEKKQGFFRRIWEMIKAAFRRVGEWFGKFFGWVSSRTDDIRTACKKLIELAKKKESKAKDEPSVVSASPFIKLVVGTRITSQAALTLSEKTFISQYDNAIGIFESASAELENIANPPREPGRMESFINSVKATLKNKIKGKVETVVKSSPSNKLPGNRVLNIEYAKEGSDYTIKVSVDSPKQEPKPSSENIEVESLSNIQGNLGDILKLLDLVDSKTEVAKKSVEKLDKLKTVANVETTIDGPQAAEYRRVFNEINESTSSSRLLITELSKELLPILRDVYNLNLAMTKAW